MAEDAVIRLGYDNSKVRAGAAQTEQIMQGTASKVKASMGAGRMGLAAGAIFGGVAAAGVAAGAVIAKSVNRFGELADQAARLGTTVESIQKLDYMGSPSGAGSEEMVDSLIKLRRAMGDVENSKAANALQVLGLSAEQLEAMAPEDQVIALAQAFQQAQASGEGFNEIYDLVGKSAKNLIPVLRTNVSTLKALQASPILSEADAALLDDVGDKLTIIGKKAEVAGAKFASWALETFNVAEGMDALNGMMDYFLPKQEKAAKQPAAPKEGPSEAQQLAAEEQRAFETMVDDTWQGIEQEQAAKEEQAQAARDQLAAELAVMEAKAAGQDKLAEKIQREIDLKQRAKDLAQQLGVDDKTALGIAQKEQSLKDQIEGKEGKGGRIKGANAAKRAAAMAAKDEWDMDRLQAGGFGERKNAAFKGGKNLTEELRTQRWRQPMAGRTDQAAGSKVAVDNADVVAAVDAMKAVLEQKLNIAN